MIFVLPAFLLLNSFKYVGLESLDHFLNHLPREISLSFVFVVNIIVLFIIGAFLGCIYGKVKDKLKKRSLPTLR